MMRITTQMLNRTAKRTGIPINQNNLMSYLNQTQSSGSTLLDALRNNSRVTGRQTQSYKNLEKTADKLQASAEKLTDSGENSIYAKAKESGDTTELCTAVKSFVDNYNASLTELGKTTDPLSAYYRQMMQEASGENKSALENIGITADKNGKLSIDSGKLKKASADDIEKAFGSSASPASKVSYIAGRVSSYAQANVQSVSSNYDQYGSLLSQMMGKYDFWG